MLLLDTFTISLLRKSQLFSLCMSEIPNDRINFDIFWPRAKKLKKMFQIEQKMLQKEQKMFAMKIASNWAESREFKSLL